MPLWNWRLSKYVCETEGCSSTEMCHFETEGYQSMSVKLKAVRQLECATLKLKVIKVCLWNWRLFINWNVRLWNWRLSKYVCETEGCSSTGMCHFETEGSQSLSVKLKVVHQLECTTLKWKLLSVHPWEWRIWLNMKIHSVWGNDNFVPSIFFFFFLHAYDK